jgi:hypothetical protein
VSDADYNPAAFGENAPGELVTPALLSQRDAAIARVEVALTEYGQSGRTLVEAADVVDLLLDVRQYLAAVPA